MLIFLPNVLICKDLAPNMLLGDKALNLFRVTKKSTTMLLNMFLPIILIESTSSLSCLKYEKGLTDEQVKETCDNPNPETGPALCFTAWHQDTNAVKTIFRQGCFNSVPGKNNYILIMLLKV